MGDFWVEQFYQAVLIELRQLLGPLEEGGVGPQQAIELPYLGVRKADELQARGID